MDSLAIVADEINKIKGTVDIFKRISYNQLLEQLSEHEKAKLHVSLSYALASLLYILNHISGDLSTVDMNKSVIEEIKHIKSYVLRLNEFNNQQSKASDEKTARKRPGSRIDREASKRMIKHQLP